LASSRNPEPPSGAKCILCPNEWRFTLDFVRLNACTGGLEHWPIPNILKVLEHIGTLKPRLFGLIDFTAGYDQTPLRPNSRDLSALYQWTRVAQQNAHELVIEQVLDHRGNRAKRSTMQFLIRWSGFGEESDTWEPYKTLLHTEPLHRYLRAHKMKSFIPAEHM